jgi:predicted small lipoprotein YifL
MLFKTPILSRCLALVASAVALAAVLGGILAACGQQGALYLPTEPAAAQRATLPESLRPTVATLPTLPPSSPLPSLSK